MMTPLLSRSHLTHTTSHHCAINAVKVLIRFSAKTSTFGSDSNDFRGVAIVRTRALYWHPRQVWEIGPEEILNVQVHDMKETVQCLTTSADLVCFASQGTGVKVYNGSGSPKHVNFSKNVKCLAVGEGNIYCGCTGYSIQEVDLSKCTSNTLYSGTRKLLGKQTIHALQIQDGVLYVGGSSVDGTAGKAFSLATKTATGSFTTGIDIHCIASTSDFVFTGTRCGVIEVWLKERLARVGSIKVGSGGSSKVTSLVSDSDGEMLFSGSADGKIQAWALD